MLRFECMENESNGCFVCGLCQAPIEQTQLRNLSPSFKCLSMVNESPKLKGYF